jgi:cytochrome bd-type quinol oxidase subunit 2
VKNAVECLIVYFYSLPSVKEMNKQLIAVGQFIISVLAGFAFGFIGIELIVGNLDFGFRLLLGVMFALIIALAEIYFLAKKLSEDLPSTQKTSAQHVHPASKPHQE